jgi:hypothetical protein
MNIVTGVNVTLWFCLRPGDAKLLKDKTEKIEPQLLGECLGHNGAIRVCHLVKLGDLFDQTTVKNEMSN